MRMAVVSGKTQGSGATVLRMPVELNGQTPPIADPLLACLAYIASTKGLPFSATGVLGRLPISDDGLLSPHLFPRAAARLGLKAQTIQRQPSKVPGLLVPFIVLFANGDAGVVIRKTKGRLSGRTTWQVVFPVLSQTPRSITTAILDEQALDVVIYVATDEAVATDDDNAATYANRHWFWGEVRRYWPAWVQVTVAAFVLNVLGLTFPLFVMSIYDRVIPNLAIPTLWALTAGICIALIFELLLRQLRAKALDASGKRIDMRIASHLFEHALSISMKDRKVEAGVMANQIREFETVRDFFTSASIIAITDLLFIGIFIFVLFVIVGPIAYVPLVAVPTVLAITMLVQLPLNRAVRISSHEASRRHALLMESLAAVETVKAVGAEGILQRRWEDSVAANARAGISTRFWSSLALYLTASIQQLVGIVVLVWGVFLVSEGKITVGGLIAANLLAGRSLAPLTNIAMTLARAQQSFVAMRSITALLKLPSDRPAILRSGERVARGDIEFRDVHFKYPGSDVEVLAGVTLRIAAGERVGILGRVGSGKSTIGKLIAGLYPASSGQVLIDGAEVSRFDAGDLRSEIGFVSQEPELFGGTIRDNITLGHPRATEAEIGEAVLAAGVDSFTRTHSQGLGRRLGERGSGLSGGQRQAVGLARMLLKKPKVLFLDEPSSAMDSNTEAALIGRIRDWSARGTTLLICSHRSSFLEVVDRLIVIEGGKIIADGPRDDIMRRLGASDAAARSAVAAS